MTRFTEIKSDPRSEIGTFRAIKRHSTYCTGDNFTWYDRTFGAIAEGEFVTVLPEMMSSKHDFEISTNMGDFMEVYMLWGGEYPIKKLYTKARPWEVDIDDIYNPHVVTEGYIISSGEVFTVIEREHEEKIFEHMLEKGGVVNIYNKISFEKWLERVSPEQVRILSLLRWEHKTDELTNENFIRIQIEDPRVRSFGPRGSYDEGWVDAIQRVR